MWLYEARIIWPPEATRVAVTIEELGHRRERDRRRGPAEAPLGRAAPHAVAGDEERGRGRGRETSPTTPKARDADPVGDLRRREDRARAPRKVDAERRIRCAPPSARRAAPRRRARPRTRRRRRRALVRTSRAARHGPRHHRLELVERRLAAAEGREALEQEQTRESRPRWRRGRRASSRSRRP